MSANVSLETPSELATAKRTPIALRDFRWSEGTATLTFPDADNYVVELSLGDFPREIIERAALKGLAELLVGRFGTKRKEPGAAKLSLNETLADLAAGTWPLEAGDGESLPKSAVEAAIRARCAFTGKPVERVTEIIAKLGKAEQAAFVAQVKSDPDTAANYHALWSKRDKGAVNLEGMGV